MSLRRIAVSVTLAVLLAAGCDRAQDRNSRLPRSGADANPAGGTPGALAAAGIPEPSDPATLFQGVSDAAQALADRRWTPPDTTLPPSVAALSYDQVHAIRFRPDRALWRQAPGFQVELFHRGPSARTPVVIHLVDGGRIATLPFDPTRFEREGEAAPDDTLPSTLGWAGFRVHYPINRPGVEDEVVAFLGASYFRLVGRGQVYGLSSRGLAVDPGLDTKEEFPAFREFWLVRPDSGAASMTFYALLDSPSVTGAYRFELTPGDPTALAVEARLFARDDVAKLGVAPLSSMYLYGAGQAGRFDDFRPQVHDSDGLLMETREGEWIWRPLANRTGLHVTTLLDSMPRGFGLAQRDRRFDDYLDLEARYHRRPSEWVQVEGGDWGRGAPSSSRSPPPRSSTTTWRRTGRRPRPSGRGSGARTATAW